MRMRFLGLGRLLIVLLVLSSNLTTRRSEVWAGVGHSQVSNAGQIAFIRNGNLWLVEPDGSGLRQLTSRGGYSEPEFSRDGGRIAFVRTFIVPSSQKQAWEIGAYNLGQNLEQTVVQAELTPFILLGNYYQYQNPRWSPDDNAMVYIAADGRASGDFVHRYDLISGQKDANFSSFMARGIDVSPVDGRIVFSDYHNAIPSGYDLHLASANGSYLAELIPLEAEIILESPRWSPDGGRIAFIRSSAFPAFTNIETLELSTYQRQVFPASPGPGNLSWSPDSLSLSFDAGEMLQFLDLATGAYTGFIAGSDPSWGRGPLAISGRVVDRDGAPISGVLVSNGEGHQDTTDSNGSYTISGLAEGRHTITPEKSGYLFVPAARTLNLQADADEVDFTGGRQVVVLVHGWQGINLDWEYSCQSGITPYPLDQNFVENGDDSLPDWLNSAGFEVWSAHLDTGPSYTAPLEEDADCLKDQIAQVRGRALDGRVILIAHSMGGLVSRAYIEGEDYGGDVSRMFTLGSPHLGVPEDVIAFLLNGVSLGAVCADWQPGACDFTTVGMLIFNLNHPERREGVSYHAVSGDAPLFTRSALGWATDGLLLGPDDGIVQTFSGVGLPGEVDRFETDETHAQIFGDNTYFVRNGGWSYSYAACIVSVLVDGGSACGPQGLLQPAIATDTPQLAAHTPLTSGFVLPSQTVTRTVALEGGSSFLVARWISGTLNMSLVDPSGTQIDPGYAGTHPDVVSYTVGADTAAYYFPNAGLGTWKIVLSPGAGVPVSGSLATTFAAFDSSIVFNAGMDHEWYAPGASATISASLSEIPTSAAVNGVLRTSDGYTQTVNLAFQTPGSYAASFSVPDRPGYAELRLAITGEMPGGSPLERGAVLAFQISPQTVVLSDAYTGTAIPRAPGSSLYEALEITVGVDATVGGRYGLSADLTAPDGVVVAHSVAVQELGAGDGALILRFDGDDIYRSQRDGPYILTHMLLTDQNGFALVVSETNDAYTTAPYRYRDFESGMLYLPELAR